MQSPKFKFLQQDLGDVFSKNLLEEEWKKRVRYQIRKQLIFDAIEYRDYNDELPELVSQIRHEVLEGSYSVRASKRYLAEKSRGLCRQMTLIHPRDLLVLERLSRTVHFELKVKAPSKSAFFEPDEGNFVKGFHQTDFQYGSFASWKRFQKHIFGFANENKYIVVTDVANFYDFINFQHLRNIVSSLADIREAVLDLLIHVLNKLTWTPDFMPLSQVGMPQIETSATRVLANALLYEVDKVCEDASVLNYARFMDDMDVGVNSIPDAKSIIRDMDLTLQSRQLRLNSSKTKILHQKDAYDHFCISENQQLSRLEKALSRAKRLPLLRMVLLAKYERWLKRTGSGEPGKDSNFKKGNGSKIHKYILKLIYEGEGRVPDEDLLWLIRNEPGMRSTALRYLSLSKRNNSNLAEIERLIQKGTFVDDASLVDITIYLLHSKFLNTGKCVELVRAICIRLSRKSDIGLHCAIFLSSRFLFRAEILKLLQDNRSRIQSDFWLARAAAGIAARFIGTGHNWNLYLEFIRGLRNDDAERVLSYLLEVASSATFPGALKSYLKAKNPAYPQQLYFPKVLVLLAASKNGSIGAGLPDIHSHHPNLRKDPFYRFMGF